MKKTDNKRKKKKSVITLTIIKEKMKKTDHKRKKKLR